MRWQRAWGQFSGSNCKLQAAIAIAIIKQSLVGIGGSRSPPLTAAHYLEQAQLSRIEYPTIDPLFPPAPFGRRPRKLCLLNKSYNLLMWAIYQRNALQLLLVPHLVNHLDTHLDPPPPPLFRAPRACAVRDCNLRRRKPRVWVRTIKRCELEEFMGQPAASR